MSKTKSIEFNYNDGGRIAAGFKGDAGDCVCRAICIATGKPYQEVYDFLSNGNATQKKSKHNGRKVAVGSQTARHGIMTNRKWFSDYMAALGFKWIPTMQIGQGCKVHLKADELPSKGRLVVNVSRHMTTVIDGVLNDTYDCSREGTRCVYGYYMLIEKPSDKPMVQEQSAEISATITANEAEKEIKPNKDAERLEAALDKKKRWTTKLKRATNALKKIEKTIKYYEKKKLNQ